VRVGAASHRGMASFAARQPAGDLTALPCPAPLRRGPAAVRSCSGDGKYRLAIDWSGLRGRLEGTDTFPLSHLPQTRTRGGLVDAVDLRGRGHKMPGTLSVRSPLPRMNKQLVQKAVRCQGGTKA